MRTFLYTFGQWVVETTLHSAGGDTRLAVIHATAKNGAGAAQSRHLVVFDHTPYQDDEQEVKEVTQNVMMKSH